MENSMSQKNIYILSASDRYNYGDLLFPIILRKELEKLGDYKFLNIATIKSDLSKRGALPTQNYKALYSATGQNNYLVVAGGEVLGANWSRLYSFLKPLYYKVYIKTKRKHILESLLKRLTGNKKNPIPFIPLSDELLNKFKVIYHAVGGAGISHHFCKNKIAEAFSKAIYISLREGETFKDIKENLKISKAQLTPDSAILMSDYYDIKRTDEKYIAFQIGRYKLGATLFEIKEQLELTYKRSGLPIYLIPIGNCPGHDDHIPLKWLEKHLNCPCKYIEPSNIEVIMQTIAAAKIFIGTSLHGIITAMSFCVPYIGFNPSIGKMQRYLKTWAPEPLNKTIAAQNIAEQVTTALNIDRTILKEKCQEQKLLAKSSFKKIHNSIEL